MSEDFGPNETEESTGGLGTKDPMQDILENKNLIFQLSVIAGSLKLAKMEGGMKTIQVLGKELIGGLFDTLDSLGQASAANALASWANPVLISGVLERFGMLPPMFNHGYHDALSKLAGVDIVTGLIESIFGKGGAFPETLAFAKKQKT